MDEQERSPPCRLESLMLECAPSMSHPALRAIIFDFNGVIADDETAHFITFQEALREDGLHLTKEEYYGRYLGMDERNCLAALLADRADGPNPDREQRIHERKASLFYAYTQSQTPLLFPGVIRLITRAMQRYRLAIASGGRREQILRALRGTSVEHAFGVLVSAEDIAVGKPDPAIYRYTLERLNARRQAEPPVRPQECVVVEDSIAGIAAGLAADMKVVGVATTYPAEHLTQAHLVLPSLEEVPLDRLEALFTERD